YYVGSCKSGSFSTISAAVKAAPAGSTIMICPGYYSEQVIISKDLTLKGLDSSAADGAAGAYIATPTSMQTTTSPIYELNDHFGPLAPVIWVTAGTVNIQNLAVHGYAGAGCPERIVGFYYATGASGTLNHVGFFGDGCGVGIWAENASFAQTAVTIENSSSAAGIVAGSLLLQNGTMAVTIKGNQLFPTSPDVNYGIYGIFLYSVSGTVEGNFISGPRFADGNASEAPYPLSVTGIFDSGGSPTDVTISGNTIQVNNDRTELYNYNTGDIGVLVNVGGATVKSNKISGVNTGIFFNCYAATVSGNTISNSYFGLFYVPPGFTGANTFYNVLVKTATDC
ncbi:MAG: hypothetical protein WAO10_19950, partial [Candidatus Sulfotelmatobacter sp.]